MPIDVYDCFYAEYSALQSHKLYNKLYHDSIFDVCIVYYLKV